MQLYTSAHEQFVTCTSTREPLHLMYVNNANPNDGCVRIRLHSHVKGVCSLRGVLRCFFIFLKAPKKLPIIIRRIPSQTRCPQIHFANPSQLKTKPTSWQSPPFWFTISLAESSRLSCCFLCTDRATLGPHREMRSCHDFKFILSGSLRFFKL